MSLTLETLAKTTKMNLEELDAVGVPLSCPYCPSDNLRYTPMGGTDKVMIECQGCNTDDVETVKQSLRLYS